MEFQEDVARLLMTLANTVVKNRNQHLEALNLTAVQADSMQYFLTHPHATIKDLKEHLDISHQTAQGLVSRLAEKELITVQRSPSDKRCQAVFVTDAGRALGEKLSANRSRTGRLLLTGMSDEEADLFSHLLRTAYENVRYDGKE